MKYEKTAKRLIGALHKNNMRQQELAIKSGVTKSSISHYINGVNVPDRDQAYKMAVVLGVTPEYLRGEDNPILITVENNDLQKVIRELDDQSLRRLTAYAEALLTIKKENETEEEK